MNFFLFQFFFRLNLAISKFIYFTKNNLIERSRKILAKKIDERIICELFYVFNIDR